MLILYVTRLCMCVYLFLLLYKKNTVKNIYVVVKPIRTSRMMVSYEGKSNFKRLTFTFQRKDLNGRLG